MELAKLAAERLESEGFANVHVRHGDGTLGWPEHARYDAVIVAAGGPAILQPLLDQLAIGGRLVIPVGSALTLQQLIRVTKTGESDYDREDLDDVRFVPLVGTAGWKEEEPAWDGQRVHSVTPERKMAELISEAAEPSQWSRAASPSLLTEIVACIYRPCGNRQLPCTGPLAAGRSVTQSTCRPGSSRSAGSNAPHPFSQLFDRRQVVFATATTAGGASTSFGMIEADSGWNQHRLAFAVADGSDVVGIFLRAVPRGAAADRRSTRSAGRRGFEDAARVPTRSAMRRATPWC